MNNNMFEGSEKARIKTLTVNVGKPTEKTCKTTEKEDVCKSVKDGGKPFEVKMAKGGGPENTDVKKPVEKSCCEEGASLRFDDIYNRIMMEGEDGVGLDTQGADMNLDNTGFNDDTGDLGNPDLDPDEADPDDIEDEDDEEGNPEDIANLKLAIKYLRKMVEKMGGDPDEEDDEDDDLDDLEVPETGDENGGEQDGAGADMNAGANPAPAAGAPAPQQPMQPQQESLQLGVKTNLGPKMSQKANGKLGHAKGKKFNWTGKKYDVSGQAKKAAKSSFGPNMGKTVSNITKGEFIK